MRCAVQTMVVTACVCIAQERLEEFNKSGPRVSAISSQYSFPGS